MSLLATFQRHMAKSKEEAASLDALMTDNTSGKSKDELSAIVKAQAALLVKKKEVLAQQRELIQKQEAQLKIQDQLIKSQKEKIAELSAKPAKAKTHVIPEAAAPAVKAPAPKAQVEQVTKEAEGDTASFLRKLFGG